MTIKELEERTGLARANIRFYEQEGLICPLRRPNGYRDYSEEDARTLEKIKLLRRLRLDLDTIRRLQAGSLTLAGAMEEQMAALEKDRAEADAARQVCRRLRDSGEGYETLSPRPYLEDLDRAPAGPHMAQLPPDWAETVAHPWVRFFARALDGAVYLLLWTVVQLFVLGWVPVTDGEQMLSRAANWCISILLFFAIEPVLLSTWGTTPGKALFGLKVRRTDGGKLSWNQALRRLTGVYTQGQCFTIPIAELFFWWKSYKLCRDGFPLPWEEETSYTVKDRASWRGAAFAAAYLAIFLVNFPLTSQAMLPPNRGELTVAEFIENYNSMARLLESGDRLDESGQLYEPEDWSGGTVIVVGGGNESEEPRFAYTEEDGVLTRVEITWQTAGGDWSGIRSGSAELAWITLVTSQRQVNGFNLLSTLDRMTQAETDWLGGWADMVQGVRCAVTAESRGYEEVSGMLIPSEDWAMDGVPDREGQDSQKEEPFYRYTAVLTLAD